MTRWKGRGRGCASASSTERAVSTSWPRAARSRWIAMPIARSSSTTRMRAVTCPAHSCAGRATSGTRTSKAVAPDSPVERRCGPSWASIVRLAMASPRPVPEDFSEKKGSKIRDRALRRHAGPVVGDLDDGAIAVAAIDGRPTMCASSGRPFWSASQRVLDEVDQDLADLVAVRSCHDVVARVESRARCRRRRARARGRARRCCDELAEFTGAELELLAPRETEEVATWRSTRSSSSRMIPACSALSGDVGSRASCWARLRAAVTGFRISWANRAPRARRSRRASRRGRASARPRPCARGARRRRGAARAGRRTPRMLRCRPRGTYRRRSPCA